MTARTIDKIEISDLFWKDLGQWRGHGSYFAIRKSIAEMVILASRGEPAGDKAFTGGGKSVWGGIRHKHVPGKLIVFTMYPESDTMRISALKKHDFYGYQMERRSRVDDAARKVRGAGERPPVRSPEWGSIRWDHPSDILTNPEVSELSAEGLTRLHAEIITEQDLLTRLEIRSSAMALSGDSEMRFMDGWMTALCDAQALVEEHMIAMATRRPDHLEPTAFEPWLETPEF